MFDSYYNNILQEVSNEFIMIEKPLDENFIRKYKGKYPNLKRVRINNDTKGVAFMSKNNLVGIINVDVKRKYIISLEVFKPYKGQGISYKLLDKAIKLGARNLSVRKTNHIALKTYKNHGWHIKSEDSYMYYMSK